MTDQLLKIAAKLALSVLFLCCSVSAQDDAAPIDLSWANGSDRRTHLPFADALYFVPSVLVDVNYTHSFNDPIDNTVVGSTALARNNEVTVSGIHLGGDFRYQNARARVMAQFGTRSTVIPRNDVSPLRGQFDLADAYRYVSEASVGYQFDSAYGVSVDVGLFMSYIGLNSFYQAENWVYQPSFTSDNTPWFFNGMRVEFLPSKATRLQLWLINGWQSYGRINDMPGVGGSFLWVPNSSTKFVANAYVGKDAAGVPQRIRYHSDNSFLHKYFDDPASSGISKAAFSVTADVGFEQGGGVNGFVDGGSVRGPAQYFASAMAYHRLWFCKNMFAITLGGGFVANPGRYLVLLPTGQASPLPSENSPGNTQGRYPFSANPGDPFTAWDFAANFDFLPNQSLTMRLEFVHRESNVPYFAGRGGVTSQSGYKSDPLDPAWRPDLRRAENRLIFVMLFRL